jgi:hypothetical protein
MENGLTQIDAEYVKFHEMPPGPELYTQRVSAADDPINCQKGAFGPAKLHEKTAAERSRLFNRLAWFFDPVFGP